MKVKEDIGKFYIDSGAHSLFTKYAKKGDYSFFDTDEFWVYVDEYAAFVRKYHYALDYYANVDVIYDPKRSWKVLKYLEREHGLHPMPVIHSRTPLKWVDKHLEAGYKYIGLGGLGQLTTKSQYYAWADSVFRVLCPASNDFKPIVDTHGFAMTSYDLLIRYPWTSVDSASWAKAGAFGVVYIPRKRNGKHDFLHQPYNITVSMSKSKREQEEIAKELGFDLVDASHTAASPAAYKRNKHLFTVSQAERKIIESWLDEIEVPLGKVDKDGEVVEWGVVSHYQARKIANLKFFTAVQNYLTALEPRRFLTKDTHVGPGLLY